MRGARTTIPGGSESSTVVDGLVGGDGRGRLGQAEQGEAHESLKSSVQVCFTHFHFGASYVPSFLFCWCLGGTDVLSKLTWPYISGAPARSPILAASAVSEMSGARWRHSVEHKHQWRHWLAPGVVGALGCF